MLKKLKKAFIIILICVLAAAAYAYFSQIIIPHKSTSFVPDYAKITLNENSSFEEIFLQTGLAKPAAEKVLSTEGIEGLKEHQETFFAERELKCAPLLGFITKSDLIETESYPQLTDVREGDIILTLSNHTLGWRHGHAGVAISDFGVAESAILGMNSEIYGVDTWCDYSQVAVLRLKDITPEMQSKISNFVTENLVGVPYKITSGFFGKKASDFKDEDFGVHCSYLVWYAYNYFGFDIDSDGGSLVSTYDILNSPLLDVVQIYGMDPRQFNK